MRMTLTLPSSYSENVRYTIASKSLARLTSAPRIYADNIGRPADVTGFKYAGLGAVPASGHNGRHGEE
jgi:hypothetical protein